MKLGEGERRRRRNNNIRLSPSSSSPPSEYSNIPFDTQEYDIVYCTLCTYVGNIASMDLFLSLHAEGSQLEEKKEEE